MKVKYQYITIEEAPEQVNFRPLYIITNNKSGDELGMIFYYGAWREYVVQLNENAVFNNTCLRNVANFMENWIPSKEKQ